MSSHDGTFQLRQSQTRAVSSPPCILQRLGIDRPRTSSSSLSSLHSFRRGPRLSASLRLTSNPRPFALLPLVSPAPRLGHPCCGATGSAATLASGARCPPDPLRFLGFSVFSVRALCTDRREFLPVPYCAVVSQDTLVSGWPAVNPSSIHPRQVWCGRGGAVTLQFASS